MTMGAVNEDPSCDESGIFRILITNDNHVGYKEDDKVRNQDAIATLEEIFCIARMYNADFVLHSGDLFDEARPNRYWVNSVCSVFRRYCFGDKEVKFEHLRFSSGDSTTSSHKRSNFEDPNLNVDLPVYMIHGNHDDLGGELGGNKLLSCCDLLETVSLVNYFGKHENVEESIDIAPILLRKGTTSLALYGLGNIRDDRLHRMFQAKKVNFLAPPSDHVFSLMAIHQNRYKGSSHQGAPSKNCVHANFLPSFLNLVVWAHEHECVPYPEESVESGFHILQSGSSVATSLTVGEQAPKNVFLLEISGLKFRITPIPLLSVRNLVLDELCVPPTVSLSSKEGESMLAAKVKEMIAKGSLESQVKVKLFQEKYREHEGELTGPMFQYPQRQPELPLVRLKLIMSPIVGSAGGVFQSASATTIPNSHILNQKFGRQFLGKVANPEDLLQIVVPKKGTSGGSKRTPGLVSLEIEDTLLSSSTAASQERVVQDLIFNYMSGSAGSLDVLVEPDFNVAVQDFVHKNDLTAIDVFLKKQIAEIFGHTATALGGTSGDILGSIHETAKQRACDIRALRLQKALEEGETNGTDKGGPPDREPDLDEVPDENDNPLLDMFMDDNGGDTLIDPIDRADDRKRKNDTTDNVSVLSDDNSDVFANARPRGQPKAAAKKRKQTKTGAGKSGSTAPSVAVNSLAAFMSQMKPPAESSGVSAPRAWARRM